MHEDHTHPAPAEADGAQAGEYLSFRLGGEEYGIPILRVQEIRGYSQPTHIANAPVYMKGVLNLRGVIVPIVDLRTRLGRAAEYNEVTATIVLNLGDRVLGIVVDAVSDVVALSGEQIRPVPEMGGRDVDTDYVRGLATSGQGQDGTDRRMLILVDIERLLARDALADLGALAA